VLDHLLVDFIASVQESFGRALLERQALEERFQVDVFLGDVSWETSYSLPGEDQPPRVQVDLSIDWPTWSQTAYRSWSMGEPPSEMPEAMLEVAMRLQRLAEAPVAEDVMAVLLPLSPPVGGEPLVLTATTIEEVHGVLDGEVLPVDPSDESTVAVQWALEGSYEGSIRFDERQLEDPSALVPVADALTRWVSSTLVKLADLPLSFLPPDPAETP